MIKVGILTLGCKVNTCESEQIREELVKADFEIVDFDSFADVYLINTCSVTNIADRKSRQMLHKARKMNPEAIVVATGCYVQVKGDQVIEAGDADLIIGNNQKGKIAVILKELLENKELTDKLNKKTVLDENAEKSTVINTNKTAENDASRQSFVDDIAEEKCFEEMQLSDFPEKSRAFVKIEDGCNQFCSYCIIPYARGRVRSRDEESIVKEVESLVANDIHEVVLTGIHLSSYGMLNYEQSMKAEDAKFNFEPLIKLIERLDKIDGVSRIRLGSLEPRIINDEFLKRLAKVRSFCPHFHLSLQSGSDTVLKRMNRHYTTSDFANRCELIRKVFADAAITTDVITGFPGETEAEFEESLSFYEKVRFAKMHIFKYSRRAGTVADKLKGQITENVKHERSVEIQKLDDILHKQFMESIINNNETIEILCEEYVNGYLKGLTRNYIPVMVEAKNLDEQQINKLINHTLSVRLTGIYDEENLLGQLT